MHTFRGPHKSPCKAKISQFQNAIPRKQHVRSFHVPVQDLALVDLVETAEHVLKNNEFENNVIISFCKF